MMGCDQCALAEDLYPIGGVNHLYLFSGIGVRGAVVVFVFADLNMTVVAYGQTGILLVLKGTLVPDGKLFMNPLIKLGETIKDAIAKRSKYVAIHITNRRFNDGFIFRTTTPGRQDGCIVVIGKILEKTIDPWFIPICFDHSGLHVIGNEHFRDAAEEAQSALDCANHILSLLRANGFHVAIVAMTESEKQNRYLMNLTSNRIHIFSVLAGKIDINLLSGGMGQIRHRQIAGLVELLQVLAKMTVTEAAGMVLPILTPQQPACDPFSAQLATEVVIMINKNLVAFGW